jgi:hypothetical protein
MKGRSRVSQVTDDVALTSDAIKYNPFLSEAISIYTSWQLYISIQVHTVHVLYAGLEKASVEIRKLGQPPVVPGGRGHCQITQNPADKN